MSWKLIQCNNCSLKVTTINNVSFLISRLGRIIRSHFQRQESSESFPETSAPCLMGNTFHHCVPKQPIIWILHLIVPCLSLNYPQSRTAWWSIGNPEIVKFWPLQLYTVICAGIKKISRAVFSKFRLLMGQNLSLLSRNSWFKTFSRIGQGPPHQQSSRLQMCVHMYARLHQRRVTW
jgi:hypothetical protein